MVRRRPLLQALPMTLVAGCAGTTTQFSDPPSDTVPSETTATTVEPREIRLKRVVTDGLGDLRIDAEMLSEMTAKSPATIKISATNAGDEAREFGFGPIPPFSDLWPENEATDSSLRLVPTSKTQYVDEGGCEDIVPEEADGCWRADCKMLVNPVEQHRTLAPDDAISANYAIVERPDSDTCFPKGIYEAKDEYPELDGSCTIEIGVS